MERTQRPCAVAGGNRPRGQCGRFRDAKAERPTLNFQRRTKYQLLNTNYCIFLHLADVEDCAKQRLVNSPDARPEAHVVRGWRRLLLWPLAVLARTWNRTLRFEASEDYRQAMAQSERPVVFLFWHNRLFVAAEIYRRFRGGRPTYGLVSASRDGAWLTAFFSLMEMKAVRGSSSRGGREAVATMVEVLRAGHGIGITPDGPRGPRYDFKDGGLVVARRAGARVLLLGMEFTSAWRLRSWDGFYLPKPFSRVRLRSAWVPDEVLNARDNTSTALRMQLLALNPDLLTVKTPV
jgi:lysophospholipid acyltransferase (LPLAT)-like uncharacterized protein